MLLFNVTKNNKYFGQLLQKLENIWQTFDKFASETLCCLATSLPLCNARLFEDGLSFHITITYRRNIFLNSVHVSVATIGPCSRRVCAFQTFLSFFLFSMIFLFRNIFSQKHLSVLVLGCIAGTCFGVHHNHISMAPHRTNFLESRS